MMLPGNTSKLIREYYILALNSQVLCKYQGIINYDPNELGRKFRLQQHQAGGGARLD